MNGMKRRQGMIRPWHWENVLEDIFKDEVCMTSHLPAVDVWEEKDQYILQIDLPGWDENEIDVTVKDNLLIVTATREDKDEENKRKYLVRERRRRNLRRSFSLPREGDPEKVKASFKNGILNLVIEKKPELKTQNIKIN